MNTRRVMYVRFLLIFLFSDFKIIIIKQVIQQRIYIMQSLIISLLKIFLLTKVSKIIKTALHKYYEKKMSEVSKLKFYF